MSITTTTDTRRRLFAVLDISRTVRELGVRCSSVIAARRAELHHRDPRPSQRDRLLSGTDRPASVVYHRTLVRRI